MKILVSYRGILHAPGSETGACLARAFRRLGHEVYEYGNYYHSAQRLGDGGLPNGVDVLVYCECNDGESQYMELQSFKTGHKVYWDFDVHTHPAKTLWFALTMGFDSIFFANKLYEKSFRQINPDARFLPYAFDDEFLRPKPEVPKIMDVGLCGSPYPEREALIKRLREAGIDARLFNGVYAEEMVNLVNGFKIHLNYNPGWGRGILNGRVWETIGCGRLLLTQREDFIDLFFEDQKHLSLYQDTEDCVRLARHWLENPDERERVAVAGHEHGMQWHTYVARAKTILETVESSVVTARANWPDTLLDIARYILRGPIKQN